MPMVRATRMLNAVKAGTISGEQLETLLTGDPARFSEFNVLSGLPGTMRSAANSSASMVAVAASSTAMALIIASDTALLEFTGSAASMAVVAANQTVISTLIASTPSLAAMTASRAAMNALAMSSDGMNIVAASSTARSAVLASSKAFNIIATKNMAMGKFIAGCAGLSPADYATMEAITASASTMSSVWASNTATDAVMASNIARLAVYNSDTALAQLQYKPLQVERLITNNATLNINYGYGDITLITNGKKIIFLRRYYSSQEYDYINWTRGSTTVGDGNGLTAGEGGRTLYTAATARGCNSGTYTNDGVTPVTNNVTGNFVCAANGLRRHSAAYGNTTQYVYYIPV